MLSRKWLVALLAFAGCRGVLGIEEPIEVEEASCLRNSDCDGSEVCLFRVCGVACMEDGDCPDGRRCVSGPDGNACVSNTVASCNDDECPSGLVCVEGACRSECGGGVDCLSDQVCVDGACQGTDAAHDPAAPRPTGGSGGRANTPGTGGKGGAPVSDGGEPSSAGDGSGATGTGGRAGDGGAPITLPGDGGTTDGGAPVTPQGGDTSDPCETGETRCSGKRLQQCEGGDWTDSVTCPFVCNPETQACGGVCVPGTPRCNQNVPELCNDEGSWDAGTPCEAICSGGACTGSCEPGSRDCNLLTALECLPDGTWDDVETCDYVCDRGECIGECEPGTSQCLSDHRTREQCGPDGEWGSGATCQYACAGGECTGSCIPGSQTCMDDNLYSCNDLGAPKLNTDCEFVCRSGRCTGSCVPMQRYCTSNNSWYECTADGAPGSASACNANQLCKDGRCEANDPYSVGNDRPLPTASPATAGNVLYLTRVTVPRRASLRKFGMHGESGQVRFGLYDDSSGPRNLLVQSDPVTIKSSMGGLVTETNPVTSIALAPGNYWIGGVYNGNAADYVGTSGTVYYVSHSYGSALPASISSPSTAINSAMNYYLVVQDLPEE